MKVEVLLATMHREDYDILNKISINSLTTVINQTNKESVKNLIHKNNEVQWINTNQRGLSKSRNMAISKAQGDICLLSDDDEILVDNYDKIIVDAYEEITDADMIIFDVASIEDGRKVGYSNTKIQKLSYRNLMKVCSVQISFKLSSVKGKSLKYSELFGPGGYYNMGDENIFLSRCYKKKMKIYFKPKTIANLDTGDSSWFNGMNKRYFYDRGAIFTGMSPVFAPLYILRFALFHYKEYKNHMSIINAISHMLEGRKHYKKVKGTKI